MPVGIHRICEGIWHLEDCLNVCMTLLAGEKKALLIDTGYGLEDMRPVIASLTPLQPEVILTHGHHDHMLGARYFSRTRMFAEDLADFRTFSRGEQRAKIAARAQENGIAVPDDYLTAPIPKPEPLAEGTFDLGGLTARILRCPGHTPGSAVIYIPERKLLLTGDDWNPCTWLFFPRAVGLREYRENLRGLMKLDFDRILCPHTAEPQPRERLESFLEDLTDENLLERAYPVEMGWPGETRRFDARDGAYIVYDHAKFLKGAAME